MKTFPMFLKMEGRRVVIFGGGEQAAQKTRLMLKTEAEIVLVATTLDPELADLVEKGRVICWGHPTLTGLFENAILCFVATGCKGADAAWHGVATDAGVIVNVVDYPDLCDAMTPSIVDRDPVVVAIGTEGKAPVLGRQIKTQIEGILEPRLGPLAQLSGRLRKAVAAKISPADRRAFWRWVFAGTPRRLFMQGNEAQAIGLIKEAIAEGVCPDNLDPGQISVVNACGRAPDEMTLKTVKRMQDADIIYFDGDIQPRVLELARRDSKRIRLANLAPQYGDPFQFVLDQTPDDANAVWLVGKPGSPQAYALRAGNRNLDVELLQFA